MHKARWTKADYALMTLESDSVTMTRPGHPLKLPGISRSSHSRPDDS